MSTYESPIGPLHLRATTRGLSYCHVRRPRPDTAATEDTEFIGWAARELEEYFAGRRTRFTVPVDRADLVLSLLTSTVGYGETTSYGELARQVSTAGCRVDAQQVGAALAANPVLILIPCHRVLGSTGRLTGYAAGLPAKRRLLDLEAAQGSLALEIA